MTPMYATNPLAEIAGEAAEAVRALNHRTLMRDSIAQPSEVYQLLGELYTLAGGLPQLLEQLSRALATQLDGGDMAIDPGSPYDDQADLAVADARQYLADAAASAQTIYQQLTAAQTAISALYVRSAAGE